MRLRWLWIATVLTVAPTASAGTFTLNDWCFYVNSLSVNRSCNNGSGVDNFNPPATSGTFDYLHLGDNANLGTATITLGPGTYNVFAIFNYDVTNGGGLNEYASTLGSLAAGQVYSVDAEGSGSTPGSLYSQFASGALDNTNHVPSCAGTCPDVAVSLGYTNINVGSGQTAHVNFIIGDTPPSSGFSVTQTDNGGGSLNFSSNVDISSDPVPEPTTLALFGGGILLMFIGSRRRKQA